MANKKLFNHFNGLDVNPPKSDFEVSKLLQIGTHPHSHFFEYSHDYLDSRGNVICRVFSCTCGKTEFRTYKD